MAVNRNIDVQSLWAKYEDIAMHFNDLLMRLRTQSLAGIAAVSALVGIFSKGSEAEIKTDWLVAEAIFVALGAFWVAIWCLDIFYYNRLLGGAVAALHKLEQQTEPEAKFDGHIDMSTLIAANFALSPWSMKRPEFVGVMLFYAIVFGLIVGGVIFSARMR